jgi:branched-subunit amino acid ABC-type transport system permease component
MDFLLASLSDGLLIGFIYGIAAMGLSLIFGVMDVINLAHGPIIALGMFSLYLLYSVLGLHPYFGLVIVAVVGLLLGMIMYAIVVRRVIDAPHLSSLLATFAVNMVIIGLGTAVFSTAPYNVDFSLGRFSVGPVTLIVTRVIGALVAILVTIGLYIFLYKSRPGRYIRAVANNKSAAELVGVPSNFILALSFGIGTMLAALAGALIATFFPFTILAGGTYELKSFVIVVLGGLGNPVGALVGGLILGLIEGIIPTFMETTWVPVVEFVMFVMILLVRPTGLFGAKQ